MNGKRRRSFSTERPSKVTKLPESSHTNVLEDEEEDLEAILEQIRQQEASEALARQLQHEYENLHDGNHHDIIDLTNDDSTMTATGPSVSFEDDEAMARRLAQEWGQLDDQPKNENPTTGLPDSEARCEPSTSRSASLCFGDSERSKRQESVPSNSYHSNGRSVGRSRPAVRDIVTVSPEVDLAQHRQLFICSRRCVKCGNSVESPRGLVTFSATVPPPTLLFLLHAICDQCNQSHCRGCFRALTCSRTCKGKTCLVDRCCADVRAIALFEALGGLDRQYMQEKENLVNTVKRDLNKAKIKKSYKKIKSVGPGGTGYSIGSASESASVSGDKGADKRCETLAARWDSILVKALDTITYLLPSPYDVDPAVYDLLPNAAIRSLLPVSWLPEIVENLLVNDSVTEWTARSTVYGSLFKLLRRMVDSELTVGVLVDERWQKKCSVGLEDWMWGDGKLEWEWERTRDDEEDKIICAPPLYDRFKKLTKLCETFLAGVSLDVVGGQQNDEETEVAIVKAVSLCGDMISVQQDIQRVLSIMTRDNTSSLLDDNSAAAESQQELEATSRKSGNRKGKGKAVGPDHHAVVDIEKNYRAACEELAFKHVTLSSEARPGAPGLVYNRYHYARNVVETARFTRQPAKRLHLIKELSSLSTSLPPGVWVRVDEIRNDIIKIMIAGPEGTPYEGGLFEFHCFIPIEYPNTPPLFHLATTGNGTVRFNPNLYSCGKVCLSLLGTWSGSPEEMWNSKSTLLQVLVSIQSMILVEAPYFNEPGHGPVKNCKQSTDYNEDIACQTVRWAMVDWMKETNRTGLWADVIKSHFTIRKGKILETIKKWAKDNSRFHRYSSSGGGQQHLDLVQEFEKGCRLIEKWEVL